MPRPLSSHVAWHEVRWVLGGAATAMALPAVLVGIVALEPPAGFVALTLVLLIYVVPMVVAGTMIGGALTLVRYARLPVDERGAVRPALLATGLIGLGTGLLPALLFGSLCLVGALA